MNPTRPGPQHPLYSWGLHRDWLTVSKVGGGLTAALHPRPNGLWDWIVIRTPQPGDTTAGTGESLSAAVAAVWRTILRPHG
jgi:hypothetical protein